MIFTKYEGASGFLYIGDPHLMSKSPNRRLEEDHEIIHVTTDKLAQSIEKANELNAIAVITGDLFTYAKDSRALLMTLAMRALKKAKHPVLCLPGNHDILANEVTDDTALAAIAESGLLTLFPEACGPVGTFVFGDKVVGLGGVVHSQIVDGVMCSQPIPEDVTDWFEAVDEVVLITHHDIAFDGAYPGSLDVYPVNGCKLIINGHMHSTKVPLRAGDTWWVNIGNIFRQTIADAKHVPSVWFWKPGMDVPEQHKLRYVVEVFDWTGKLGKAAAGGSLIPEMGDDDEDKASYSFVTELSAAIGSEMPKSHDAGILLEDIESVKEETKPKDDVVTIINSLHKLVSKQSISEDQP